MRCCPTTAQTGTSMIRLCVAQSCTWCPQVTNNLFCSPGSTPSCECGRKVGHKKESRKGAFDHHDTLETGMPSEVYFFDSNPSSHNSQGADWLLRHSKLTTLYTVCYEIKYTVTRLSCVRSKIQQLCLIYYALDLGDTCWDELLAAWFLQVQQILSKTTHTCLVLARSKPLMTACTTDTCLVQQIEAQSNPCAVAMSELNAWGKPL